MNRRKTWTLKSWLSGEMTKTKKIHELIVQKKSPIRCYVNVLIKLRSLWPYTQTGGFPTSLGTPSEHTGAVQGKETFAQTSPVAETVVSSWPRGGCAFTQRRPSPGRPSNVGRNALQLTWHRRTRGAEAAPAGTHLSSTCSANARDPLSPDTCLAGWAPCSLLRKWT